MDSVIVYNTPHLMHWDWRIAADLFFGGIGVGAFLVAVLSSLFYKDKYPLVSKIGAVLSPVFVIVGLFFMLSELGHPLRLFHTVTGFNISSPMSWGGPFQGLLIVIGIVYAYLWLKSDDTKLRNIAGIIGIPVALIVGIYHGWLLAAVTAHPLWNTAFATVAAVTSFATTGIAAVLLVVCFKSKKTRDTSEQETGGNTVPIRWAIRSFLNLLLVALIVHGVVVFMWCASLYYGATNARDALATAGSELGSLFWVVAIGLGLVLPIVLAIAANLTKAGDNRRVSVSLAAITSILILVGGFVFRYATIIAGQLS